MPYQTYMVMLHISTPVLIDDSVSRHFLEQAQNLGGEMTLALAHTRRSTGAAQGPDDRLGDAMQQLQSAAAPLLQPLKPAVRNAIQHLSQSTEN